MDTALAPLRMTATEWDGEQRLRQAAVAAAAGAARIHLADPGVDVELVALKLSAACWGYRCKRRRRPRSNSSARWMPRSATDSPHGSTTRTDDLNGHAAQ